MHRNACVVSALLAGVGLCAGASAQTLKLTQNPFSVGNGGEFTVTVLSGNAGLTGLAGDLSPVTFETFCVEHNENFQPGETLSFVMNTGAVGGGVSGQTSPSFDDLDPRTAYLYTEFRYGTLAGFDYGAGRTASAGALQDAIWFIEGEGGANNAFVALATAAVTNNLWTGIGDVRVLNITRANGDPGQDQLTLVPAPGAAALLGGAGLLLGARRRRSV